jgi:hypothetical protein
MAFWENGTFATFSSFTESSLATTIGKSISLDDYITALITHTYTQHEKTMITTTSTMTRIYERFSAALSSNILAHPSPKSKKEKEKKWINPRKVGYISSPASMLCGGVTAPRQLQNAYTALHQFPDDYGWHSPSIKSSERVTSQ